MCESRCRQGRGSVEVACRICGAGRAALRSFTGRKNKPAVVGGLLLEPLILLVRMRGLEPPLPCEN